ncbi:ComEC/Rec2 family competence protein [Sphingomicrobium aestuariivivum]|uniref:ComEC/Rec2 family competence protein n=1 Tax=Sphingomicrobium aestuariivivum TaxID=1582356 RepID=UPI001FD6B693|nr:ComEC/Rec2 family competence protein [Sphingomicrobium aestuariivivum]MCJ8190078.1 ComEC family competence protein [Sphingomicrobium aestuariivivum]
MQPGRLGGLVSAWALVRKGLERLLEAERAQLPLWIVTAFGAGVALWFVLPGVEARSGAMLLGLGLAGLAARGQGRARRFLMAGLIASSLGCGWIWLRAEMVAHEVLDRVRIASFEAEVEKVEPLTAKDKWRLTLAVEEAGLPARMRISLRTAQYEAVMGEGARLRLRARLTPPPSMSVPGGYDFARTAWFRKIGAVGTALGEVEVLAPAEPSGLASWRMGLGERVRTRLPGRGDGIATALATGDKNAVAAEDAEAMRRSGLAHLLAVSGLHIAAVVGGTMLLSLRLLALFPRLAARTNLIIVSAAIGALAGVGYTLLTGMQVATVRACIAALLVLLGMALGREALSLRMVAAGATIILLFRPEAIAGASFQLSFAAVTAIIALHAHPVPKRWLAPRDDGWSGRMARGFLALLLTGLAVELALIPFALFHFHKAGLYGVAANLIAIPLTTFVIMPALAAALLLDLVGLGAPFWWLTGLTLDLLTALAHGVATSPGAVAMVPSMPAAAFALCISGFLWLCLWQQRWRWLGLPLWLAGIGMAMAAPRPALLVTGDGRHLALLDEAGVPHLLRARAGDFVRDMLAEGAGHDGALPALEDSPLARCNRDACLAVIEREGRQWRVLATRSRDFIAWRELVDACEGADIVVSERWLPKACSPRWLKLDRETLARTGGMAIHLGEQPRVETVAARSRHLAWSPYSASGS